MRSLVGFFFVQIPAILFLGAWIGLQLWLGGGGLTHPEEGGGVQLRTPPRPAW